MADVFLSYRNTEERRALVKRFAIILRAHGFSVWWDFGLEAGDRYREQIARELSDAKVVIPFWCRESIESRWVLIEAELGKDKLLPVRLQKVDPPAAFEGIQSADFVDWDGSITHPSLTRLVAKIAQLLGRTERAPEDSLDELRHLPKLHPIRTEPVQIERRSAEPHPPIGTAIGPWLALALVALIGVAAASYFLAQDSRPALEAHESSRLVADVEGATSASTTASPAQSAAATSPGAPPANGFRFDDCNAARWCPRMVVIPTGTFVMGSPTAEPGREDDEGPQRRVVIGTFGISVDEITVGQWSAYAEETALDAPRDCFTAGAELGSWDAPGFLQEATHPVTCVSWQDANAYAEWLTSRTGQRYRLPTEAEWEYAARGGSSSTFSWGARVNATQANYGDAGINGTSESGRYGANAFGLRDSSGNVAEWVQDCYRPTYAGAPTDGSALTISGCEERVLRGGSWGDHPSSLRVANRNSSAPSDRGSIAGFRLVRELD